MFSFFQEGSQVGFSINGIGGAILLFYIVIDLVFLATTKMSLIHKLILLPYVIYQVNKIVPKHWRINNFYIFLFFRRIPFNRYEVYISLKSKIIYDEPNLNFDYVGDKYYLDTEVSEQLIVNFFGKIISQDFEEQILKKDSRHHLQIKRWYREKKLKNLGIN